MQEQRQTNSGAKLVGAGLLVAVLIAAGVFVFVLGGEDDMNSNQDNNTSNAADNNSSPAATTSGESNQDQTETGKALALDQTIDFRVPEGHENSIDVSLKVMSDGTIESVSSTVNYSDSESAAHNRGFDEASQAVVGQKIDAVDESKIGDASLTSAAFYSALRTAAAQL